MKYKTLKYSVNDDIATLMLDQPPQNVMNWLFFEELLDVCEDQIIRENFAGLIITGKGRHFSSGADTGQLTELIKASASDDIPDELKRNLRSFTLLNNLKKPTFAVVNGACFGSGLELALCARYRIVTKNALFALPEASFGLMPGLGGVYKLRNLIGAGNALEVALGGKFIDAREARKLGLADLIAERKEVMKVAIAKITELIG